MMILSLIILLATKSLVYADYIPSTTVTGPVSVVTSSSQSAFDGPGIGAVNSTAFDWWYFDAVTSDGTATIQIVFFRSVQSIDNPVPSVDYIQVTASWDDGTTFDQSFPALSSSVTTQNYGASGSWPGVGTFEGSPNLEQYTVALHNSVLQGVLTMQATAPAHYPNGSPPGSESSTILAPTINWANTIPAGIASCRFTIEGVSLDFNGTGYHDQNWGGLLLSKCVESWYWGRATVGSYSLVWFVVLSAFNSNLYSSAYLVNNGHIDVAGQTIGVESLSVIPVSYGTHCPASIRSNLPSGFVITFNAEGKQWKFEADSNSVVFDNSEGGSSGYTRWVGIVTGGEIGGVAASGNGLWEWLRFQI